MLNTVRLISFFLFCLLSWLLAAQAATGEDGVVSLEWQLPGFRTASQKSFIRFRAQADHNPPHRLPEKDEPLSGEISVTGRVGQQFTVCAASQVIDGLIQLSESIDAGYVKNLTLTKNTGLLNVNNSKACPDWVAGQPPRDRARPVHSAESFLTVRKEKPGKHSQHDTHNKNSPASAQPFAPFASFSPFPREPPPQVTLDGAGSGFDDGLDDDSSFNRGFKRPPFMPVLNKPTASLVLLPHLIIPDRWRDYLPSLPGFPVLPGHGLMSQSEAANGLALLVHFEGRPPVTLFINKAEYSEMVDSLLSVEELLLWLTPKLNGYEAMVHSLSELQQIMTLQEADDIDEIQTAVRQQLAMILEQPHTEFSLEFETGWLANIFGPVNQSSGGLTDADNPEKQSGDNRDKNNDQKSHASEIGHTVLGEDLHRKKSTESSERNPEDIDPDMLMATAEPLAAGGKTIEASYVLWINGKRYYLRDKKIQHKAKTYRDISDKHVTVTDDQGETIALAEVEKKAGLAKQQWLYNQTGQGRSTLALDYLLYYGDDDSLKAYLNNHFPPDLTLQESENLPWEINHNYPQEHGRVLVPLMALLYHRPDFVRLKPPGSGYRKLLIYSVSKNLIATTSILLKYVQDQRNLRFSVIDGIDRAGQSLLHIGARQSPQVLELLLKYPYLRLNRKNKEGHTPLHIALKEGHYENARLLYDAGSNPDIVAGHTKKRPLRQLYPQDDDDKLAFLHQPRPRKKLYGPEQLKQAIKENDLAALFIWLENAPAIDVFHRGLSPIQMAAQLGRPEVIKILFQYYRHQLLEPVISDLELNDLLVLVHRLESINGLKSGPVTKTAIYRAAFNNAGNNEDNMLSRVKETLEAFLTEYLRPLLQALAEKKLPDMTYIINQLVEQHNLPVAGLRLDDRSKQAIKEQCVKNTSWQENLKLYQRSIERLLQQESMEAVIQLLKTDEPELQLQLPPVTGVPFTLQVRRIIPEIAGVLSDYAQQLAGRSPDFALLRDSVANNQSKTPLALACAEGFLPVVDMLLNLQGYKRSENNSPESTPLHIAVQQQKPLLVLKLLANGVIEPDPGKRAQLFAIAKGNNDDDIAEALANNALGKKGLEKLFRRFLPSSSNRGATSESPVSSAGDLLHIAVETGEQSYVEQVLSSWPDKKSLQSVNSLGKTPLESALDKGYSAIARKLLEQDQKNNNCQLFDAVRKGKFQLLQQLAEAGARLYSLQDSCSLIYTAVENNQAEIVKWLVKRLPANLITQAAANSLTPLALALARKEKEQEQEQGKESYQTIIELLEHSGQ